MLRLLAAVGLTSREACGDTVRNVAGCHLAGACPYEVLDISPWAEATTDLFLRNPLTQRLPRKFKINFSGCATDCGQAMFNDIGVVAREPPAPRRHHRARLPGVHGRRARRQPTPGAGARGVHLPRGPAADDRGRAAACRPLRQPRQQAPGPHEVAGRHHGHRRAARPDRQGAQVPHRASATYPGAGIPERRGADGDAPAGIGTEVDRRPRLARSSSPGLDPLRQVGAGQRRARPGQRHGERVRALPLGDITTGPVPRPRRPPARLRLRDPHHQPAELRAAGSRPRTSYRRSTNGSSPIDMHRGRRRAGP